MDARKQLHKYFKNKKVNLVPLNYNTINYLKLSELKPLGIIISGGNNLYNFKKSKENLIRDKFEIK